MRDREAKGDIMAQEVLVLSERWFADVDLCPLFDKDMIISIMSPGQTHPRMNVYGVPRLNIQFHDIVEEICVENTLWLPMQPEYAAQIVDFMQESFPWCDRLVIHCEAGISRSAGVAVGLSRYFDLTPENTLRDQHPHFNIHVASSIWKECQLRGLMERVPQ